MQYPGIDWVVFDKSEFEFKSSNITFYMIRKVVV